MNRRDYCKLEAERMRGAIGDMAVKCDLCHVRPGTQYHELVARSKTIGNSEARERSYAPELCSLLCPQCHDYADSKDNTRRLWQFNTRLFGKERMSAAIDHINQALKARIVVDFDE